MRRATRTVRRRIRNFQWDLKKATTATLSKCHANGTRKIYVAGLLRSATGLGDASAMLQATLANSDLSIETEAIDIGASFQPAAPTPEKRDARSLAVGRGSIVACVNPPQASAYFRRLSVRRLIGKRRIGYWWWEFPGFPEQWKEFIGDIDEVWVSSQFIYQNWQPLLDVPVRWVPLDLRAGNLKPALPDQRLDRPIRLLTVANLGSTLTRKNPAAAIKVFERVRDAARRPVTLTIKVGKLGQYPDRYREFLKLNTTQAGINVIVSELSDRDFDSLIDDHDIYLSMHRAEGLGLPLAKAMLRGKVVVATRWSGNLEYMTEDSSLLVDFLPTTIHDENENSLSALDCAEPSVDDAVEKILELINHPEQFEEIGRRARRRIIEVSELAVDHNHRQFTGEQID